MKYKDLQETDNFHEMPWEHLHTEVHKALTDVNHFRTGNNRWQYGAGWGHSYHFDDKPAIYQRLKDMGWRADLGASRGGMNVFYHPSGAKLTHLADIQFEIEKI